MSEVLQTRADLRVLLVPDTTAAEPYDEGRSPILRLHPLHWWGGWRAEYITSLGGYTPTAITNIVTAAEKWASEPDRFERYLRMVHGTTEIQWYDTRPGSGEFLYVTFDTTDWRAHHHLPDHPSGNIDMSDWRAYCEGDVYGYIIEQRTLWARVDAPHRASDIRESWEPIDSQWGLYGRQYAENCAIQRLNDFAPTTAPERLIA